MVYDGFDRNSLILRDHLAIDRTKLANERTFLAYLRTAIMLLISGITILKLFESNQTVVVIGYFLIPAGVAVGILGYIRFRKTGRKIALAGESEASQSSES